MPAALVRLMTELLPFNRSFIVMKRNGRDNAAITGYRILLSSIHEGSPLMNTMTTDVQAMIPAYTRCLPGTCAKRKNRQEMRIRSSNISHIFRRMNR
jgi:hypothetical protein